MGHDVRIFRVPTCRASCDWFSAVNDRSFTGADISLCSFLGQAPCYFGNFGQTSFPTFKLSLVSANKRDLVGGTEHSIRLGRAIRHGGNGATLSRRGDISHWDWGGRIADYRASFGPSTGATSDFVHRSRGWNG